ncbi:VanZ family protein [Evansella sp. AB-rgal1]|uniref:VanZ family protein n=1 Tax=Evansella sp. AB-rgal1 TaxID=3242696 RepID=UPI00359ED73B
MKKSIILSFLISQISFFSLWPFWLQLTKYLHNIVLLVVWFCFTLLISFLVFYIRKDQVTMKRSVLHSITLFYTLSLLTLLFFRPNDQSYDSINLIPFEMILFYFSGQVSPVIAFYNISANIGLFIPFGIYYCYISKQPSIWRLTLLTICSITVIELTQFFTNRGSLDIDDLILNVCGVILGYTLFPLVQQVITITYKQKR